MTHRTMTHRTGMHKADRSDFPSHASNVGSSERWVSALAGLGLMLSAGRARGGMLGRLLRSSAGLSLLARGATGYCAVKGAVNGEGSLRDGLREQWHRLSGLAASATRDTGLPIEGGRIDTMSAMYSSELQELHSAELQLGSLAERMARLARSAPFGSRVREYAKELQVRRGDIENLLMRLGADRREHPDDAMRALIDETDKMAEICADKVRDAALVASLQRILHYKIAGYGTIAAYAKALGRLAEASHFAQLAERDRAIDAELTELAKSTLNPEAVVAPQEPAAAEMRTH